MTKGIHRTTATRRLHRTTAVPTHVPSSTGPQAVRGMGIRRDDDSAADKRDDDDKDKDKKSKDDDDSDSDKTEREAAPPNYTGEEDS